MSKKRNKRNNKSVLKHLKAKRANFNRGGYGGYTDGSRNRSDSVPVENYNGSSGYTDGSRPRSDSVPYIPAEEERDTYQDYQGDDYVNVDVNENPNNDYYTDTAQNVEDGQEQNGGNQGGPGQGGGPWWRQKGYSSYAEAIADGWRYVAGVGWTQSGGGNNNTQDGTSQGQVDPNRTERVQRTGVTAEAIAQGEMPEGLPTIPDAGKIDRTGTELDAGSQSFKMQKTGYARASGVADTSKEKVTEGDVTEAGDIEKWGKS